MLGPWGKRASGVLHCWSDVTCLQLWLRLERSWIFPRRTPCKWIKAQWRSHTHSTASESTCSWTQDETQFTLMLTWFFFVPHLHNYHIWGLQLYHLWSLDVGFLSEQHQGQLLIFPTCSFKPQNMCATDLGHHITDTVECYYTNCKLWVKAKANVNLVLTIIASFFILFYSIKSI